MKKYAIIADVHGNLPALVAVMQDAERQGVDHYLFGGDYYADLPYPNEVAELLARLTRASYIRGNKEDYLLRLEQQDQATWTYEQMAALYWNYRTLTPANRHFLTGLPEDLTLTDESGQPIRLFHSSRHLFADTRIDDITSRAFALRMREKPFDHGDYLSWVAEWLDADKRLGERIGALPVGVYLFGHTHVQWHARLGQSLLINPGSCGLPLDGNPAAPYTLLTFQASGWQVEERRVAYDCEETIHRLEQSDLYREAEIWSKLIIQQLRTAEEQVGFFLQEAEQVAREHKSSQRPYTNDIWRAAARKWFGE